MRAEKVTACMKECDLAQERLTAQCVVPGTTLFTGATSSVSHQDWVGKRCPDAEQVAQVVFDAP